MIDETLKCGSNNILVVSMKCESNKHIKNYSKKDLNTQANNTKTKNTTFVDVHQDALDEQTGGRAHKIIGRDVNFSYFFSLH